MSGEGRPRRGNASQANGREGPALDSKFQKAFYTLNIHNAVILVAVARGLFTGSRQQVTVEQLGGGVPLFVPRRRTPAAARSESPAGRWLPRWQRPRPQPGARGAGGRAGLRGPGRRGWVLGSRGRVRRRVCLSVCFCLSSVRRPARPHAIPPPQFLG